MGLETVDSDISRSIKFKYIRDIAICELNIERKRAESEGDWAVKRKKNGGLGAL